MIVEARKSGDGRSVMKLMKMKKNLPDEAGAAPQAPPAVVPQPVPVVQQPAPVAPVAAARAKEDTEIRAEQALCPNGFKKSWFSSKCKACGRKKEEHRPLAMEEYEDDIQGGQGATSAVDEGKASVARAAAEQQRIKDARLAEETRAREEAEARVEQHQREVEEKEAEEAKTAANLKANQAATGGYWWDGHRYTSKPTVADVHVGFIGDALGTKIVDYGTGTKTTMEDKYDKQGCVCMWQEVAEVRKCSVTNFDEIVHLWYHNLKEFVETGEVKSGEYPFLLQFCSPGWLPAVKPAELKALRDHFCERDADGKCALYPSTLNPHLFSIQLGPPTRISPLCTTQIARAPIIVQSSVLHRHTMRCFRAHRH